MDCTALLGEPSHCTAESRQQHKPWYYSFWDLPALLSCRADLDMQPAGCLRDDLHGQLLKAVPILRQVLIHECKIDLCLQRSCRATSAWVLWQSAAGLCAQCSVCGLQPTPEWLAVIGVNTSNVLNGYAGKCALVFTCLSCWPCAVCRPQRIVTCSNST
jgi:hypothetical protein